VANSKGTEVSAVSDRQVSKAPSEFSQRAVHQRADGSLLTASKELGTQKPSHILQVAHMSFRKIPVSIERNVC